MKKNNLLKISLIVFVCVVFLSWLIPVGQYTSGQFVQGNIKPVGIFDLPKIPLFVFDIALPSILFIAVVCIFYGVLNKTGVYSKMIESFTKKFSKCKIKFLVSISIIMILLSALVGLNFGFFIMIPFISAIILSLGFSKITTMLATIGSVFVGMMGSIYGSDISYYITELFGNNTSFGYNTQLFPDKIILLILVSVLLIFYIIKRAKTEISSKVKNEEIPMLEKDVSSKRSYKPLFVILMIMFVVILVATFKWDSVLSGTPMLDFYKKIMEIKVGGFPIVANLLGAIPAFGYWSLPTISVFILLVTIIVCIVYKIKIDDIIDAIGKSLSKNMKLFLYAICAYLVLAVLYNNGDSSNFASTITNYLSNITDKFSSIMLSIITLIGSFFYNSFDNLISVLYIPTVGLTGTTVHLVNLATIIMKAFYGLVMMIAPTSLLLLVGLSYFDISYKEWFKNIWKLLLELFVVLVLIIIILTIFI